jgi:transposase
MEKIETANTSTIEELEVRNMDLEKQNEALQAKIKWLEEQFRVTAILKQTVFARIA